VAQRLDCQVVKRSERRRVVKTEAPPRGWAHRHVFETLRRRSQGDGVINTAYIERLHATFPGTLGIADAPWAGVGALHIDTPVR